MVYGAEQTVVLNDKSGDLVGDGYFSGWFSWQTLSRI